MITLCVSQVADFLGADIFLWAAAFCAHLVSAAPCHTAAWAALQQTPAHLQDTVLAQHPVLLSSSSLCAKLDALPTSLHVQACRSCYRMVPPFSDLSRSEHVPAACPDGSVLPPPHLHVAVPPTRHIAAELAAVLPQLTELRSLTLQATRAHARAPLTCEEQLLALAAVRHIGALRSLALQSWQPDEGDVSHHRAALWAATQLSHVSLQRCACALIPSQAIGATLHLRRLDCNLSCSKACDSRDHAAVTREVFPALQHLSSSGLVHEPPIAVSPQAAALPQLKSFSWCGGPDRARLGLSPDSVALRMLLTRLQPLQHVEWWPGDGGSSEPLLRRKFAGCLMPHLLQLRHLAVPISYDIRLAGTGSVVLQRRADHLFSILSQAPQLSHLSFIRAALVSVVAPKLSPPPCGQDAGKRWPALQELQMRSSGHTDASLTSMLAHFSSARLLRRLDVSCNPACGDVGAAALVRFLAAVSQLRILACVENSGAFVATLLQGLCASTELDNTLASLAELQCGCVQPKCGPSSAWDPIVQSSAWDPVVYSSALCALGSVLGSMRALTSLEVVFPVVKSDSLVNLCSALRQLVYLRTLRLSCPVQYDARYDQEVLAGALCKLHGLQQSDFAACGLRGACLAQVLAELGRSQILSAVVVRWGSCGEETIAELARLVQGCQDLVLHVQDWPSPRDDAGFAARHCLARLREAAPRCRLMTA